jgi:hypothetical protein
MSSFKKMADLRNAALRDLLVEMERERDTLLDEVAEKRGRAAQLEKSIARVYEMILDINKDEQTREAKHLAELAIKEQQEKERAQKQAEREAFDQAIKGVKTPRPERRRKKE